MRYTTLLNGLCLCTVLVSPAFVHAVDRESVGEEAAEVREETAEYESEKKDLYLKEKKQWLNTMNTDYKLLREEIDKSGHAVMDKNGWISELDEKKLAVETEWKRMDALKDTSWKDARDNFEQYIGEFKMTSDDIRKELRMTSDEYRTYQTQQNTIIKGSTSGTTAPTTTTTTTTTKTKPSSSGY